MRERRGRGRGGRGRGGGGDRDRGRGREREVYCMEEVLDGTFLLALEVDSSVLLFVDVLRFT